MVISITNLGGPRRWVPPVAHSRDLFGLTRTSEGRAVDIARDGASYGARRPHRDLDQYVTLASRGSSNRSCLPRTMPHEIHENDTRAHLHLTLRCGRSCSLLVVGVGLESY